MITACLGKGADIQTTEVTIQPNPRSMEMTSYLRKKADIRMATSYPRKKADIRMTGVRLEKTQWTST